MRRLTLRITFKDTSLILHPQWCNKRYEEDLNHMWWDCLLLLMVFGTCEGDRSGSVRHVKVMGVRGWRRCFCIPPLGKEALCCGQPTSLFYYRIFGSREIKKFLEIRERSGEEAGEIVRFNASLWTLNSRTIRSYHLGLVFLDWSLFL